MARHLRKLGASAVAITPGILFFVSLFSAFAQSPMGLRSSTPIVTIEASNAEWLDGYLRWAHAHPAAWHRGVSKPNVPRDFTMQSLQTSRDSSPLEQPPELKSGDSDTSAPEPILLHMPMLQLFTPNGRPLYRGNQAETNAAFIRSLPQGMSAQPLSNADRADPTLAEFLDMVPELRPYKPSILGGKRYTLLAISYSDRPFCKPQNDAVAELVSRARSLHLRIVQVMLRIGDKRRNGQ